MKSGVVTPTVPEDGKAHKAVQTDLHLTVHSEQSPESADLQLDIQPGTSKTESFPPDTSPKDPPPSSPVMDLETDFPSGERSD